MLKIRVSQLEKETGLFSTSPEEKLSFELAARKVVEEYSGRLLSKSNLMEILRKFSDSAKDVLKIMLGDKTAEPQGGGYYKINPYGYSQTLEAAFKEFNTPIHLAVIKDRTHYNWYEYTGEDSVYLITKNKKREEVITQGSKFGIRNSSSGMDLRLVTEKLGDTIVFTIDHETYGKLINSAKLCKAPQPIVPDLSRVMEEVKTSGLKTAGNHEDFISQLSKIAEVVSLCWPPLISKDARVAVVLPIVFKKEDYMDDWEWEDELQKNGAESFHWVKLDLDLSGESSSSLLRMSEIKEDFIDEFYFSSADSAPDFSSNDWKSTSILKSYLPFLNLRDLVGFEFFRN